MPSSGVQKRGSATTVRACDSCRKRKRRCLWDQGASKCTYCTQLKEECTTTYVRKPRSKAQKRDRVVEYERRIQNLEHLLKERSDAQPQIQSQPLQPLPVNDPNISRSLSSWMDSLRTEVEQFPLDATPDLDPTTYTGPYQLTGAASSISGSWLGQSATSTGASDEIVLQSLEHFEPSAEFKEDAALLQDPSFQPPPGLEDLNIDDPIYVPPSNCDQSLPEPELGVSLVAEFLVDFNTVFSLYRPKEIAEHIRICYEGRSDGTALAWASAYVVLGIAHRARAQSNIATPMDNELADFYLYRTIPAISGLLMAPPSLPLVQCLLGLAILTRTSSNSQPSGVFISTALRIAQHLAYEDGDGEVPDPTRDVEQERRVFWCAFVLSTEDSIFSNAPTTHRKEDIRAPFPDEDPPDSLGSVAAAEGDLKVNLFALLIRLALIQSEAIEKVLSVSARSSDLDEAAHTVLARLGAWRDNELFRRDPDQLMQLLYRSDLIHVLSVEASYFATVFRVHAFLALSKNPLVNPFSADVLAIIAAQKEHGAFKDAERLLTHLTLIPHGDIGICWMIKLPVIAAFTTVLSHHLHSPSNTLTSKTMHEYSRILTTLQNMAEKSQDLELLRARDLCMILFSKVETRLQVKRLDAQVSPSSIGSH